MRAACLASTGRRRSAVSGEEAQLAKAWQVLERSETSDGVLELRKRDEGDFLITQDGRVLMNSRAQRSEEALGELGASGLHVSEPRVLVAGLGMGCTLSSALGVLPATAEVVVAELHAPIVDWCRQALAPLTGGAVLDPRVRVVLGDVNVQIGRGGWDAILLDLFEGPTPGSKSKPHPHYGDAALAQSYRALNPGGRLAIWSEDPDPSFRDRLEGAGFAATMSRPGRARRHVIYVATRPC